MSAFDERIAVALGFDANFVAHAAATIASIVRRVPAKRFHFLLLHDGVDQDDCGRIEAVAPEARFTWIRISAADVPAFTSTELFTRAILFRLGLERLAPPEIHRIIYVDCDLVVLGDLAELWHVDLEGNLLGAVADGAGRAASFARRWNLPICSGYFNSGVLLIDLEAVRREGAFAAALQFLGANANDLDWPDQDALNWACWGKWLALDSSWNVQRVTPAAARRGVRARVVHFTGADKPWRRGGYHPWAWVYWSALRRTPYFSEGLRNVGWAQVARAWLRWLNRPAKRATRKDWLAEAWTDLSLVIATRNRAARLEKCLQAVATSNLDPRRWELIVVDNGSTDETPAIVESARAYMPAAIKYLREPIAGSGRARNSGTAVSRGRIVAYTDDDCYIEPDFLERVVAAFEDDGQLGWLTGRVELYDASDAQTTCNPSRKPRRYNANRYIYTDDLIGANLCFRREVLEQIGGFDENFGAGASFAAEDMDAASRASGWGWEGAYDPSVALSHHHGRKAGDVDKLHKFYDIGRGAYTIKYLFRGQMIQFVKGVVSVRWRMGSIPSWDGRKFAMLFWETFGGFAYVALRARQIVSGRWTTLRRGVSSVATNRSGSRARTRIAPVRAEALAANDADPAVTVPRRAR